jgi:hypothetical protein
MIDAPRLLADCRQLVLALEDDLRHRLSDHPDLDATWRSTYSEAVAANRTGAAYEVWRDEQLTQVAVAWVLAVTFVRFCEDNELIPDPIVAGPDERLRHAEDRQTLYFRGHPDHSDREYLTYVLDTVAALPAMAELLDRSHNPLWTLAPTADGATAILDTFRRSDPDTGQLIHDFTDPALGTRFLGDLYQDLSEAARKRYALLQTPDFIEEWLLSRTLDPAIDTFGLEHTTLIDPTCGSGHFLLGAFDRLLAAWQRQEPGTSVRELVRRTVAAIAGVDINPFAVAIARFRLLVAALNATHITRLADAPAFHFELAAGDSLLHGRIPGQLALDPAALARTELAYVYRSEDGEALRRILLKRHYSVVVGNPPYVTVKDGVLSGEYRSRFPVSCRGKYAASVPFTERFLDLAASRSENSPAGYVGMITANSFMKREMGKGLVEKVLPKWDLTHVVDTSGAYIPGHGTPTVILLLRCQIPELSSIRTVMGIRGEPSRPDDPTKGLVWSAIVNQVDEAGSESDFVSVTDTSRTQFASHPWSIGGGGAAELRTLVEQRAISRLVGSLSVVGFGAIAGEDDVYIMSGRQALRLGGMLSPSRALGEGETVRDWRVNPTPSILFPYSGEQLIPELPAGLTRHFWRYRSTLVARSAFGKSIAQHGLEWFEYIMFFKERYRTPLSITFAFVATHNHFVLDRGGKVFNRSAPVIKLPAGASEDDHLALLGLLNSAPACFWMQQVFHNKGAGGGARVAAGYATMGDEGFLNHYEFDGTKLKQFPLPAGRPLGRARRLDTLAQELATVTPDAVAEAGVPTRDALAAARAQSERIKAKMIAVQEELDWEVLGLYGLADATVVAPPECVPPLALGERAFEIVLARQVEAGETVTAWFGRHRSTPITEIPAEWPEEYRRIVQARIDLIGSDRDVALIERPECKRRWATEPWEDREQDALRSWLLDRMEAPDLWVAESARLRSAGSLADALRSDASFLSVAALYGGRPDVDLTALVTELAKAESVPYLAAWRYTDSGLRIRAVWERTWDLQRAEDRGEAVGVIPAPPRYTQKDFRSVASWKLRGKLDVPKERWVVYPDAGRDTDPTPLLGWAGWDQRTQALALAGTITERRDEGWDGERLTPLLAGVLELLPWVRQWHPEPDPAVGQPIGVYLESWLSQSLLDLGLTRASLSAWRAPQATRGRRRAATSNTNA